MNRGNEMTNLANGRDSRQQYSDRTLWAASIFVLLALAIILESICLGSLYIYNWLSGQGNRGFAQNHILTSLFVSAPTSPVPGKHFIGHLRDDDQWEEFLVPDGLLGWRLGSNIAVYYSPSSHSSEYLYLTDDNGFSADVDDPPVAMQKPTDVYRVVVLGGSTVMGDGSPRPSQNLVGMLRNAVHDQQITAADGRRVEFINAGVDGYNSGQEYLYFVSDLARFKPDLLVVYDGWNDSFMWTDRSVTRNMSPFRTQTHEDGTRRIKASYSISGSVVLTLANLKSSLTDGHFRLGITELPWRVFRKSTSNEEVDRRSETYDSHLIEYYRQTHRAFLALADDQLAVAVFLQPLVGTDGRALSDEEKASWWYPELEWEMGNRIPFYEDGRRVLAELKQISRGKQQACIADLSDSLKGETGLLYADTGHLFPVGNRIVASRILDELASCGLMAKRAP
jgi:hypothetical protein